MSKLDYEKNIKNNQYKKYVLYFTSVLLTTSITFPTAYANDDIVINSVENSAVNTTERNESSVLDNGDELKDDKSVTSEESNAKENESNSSDLREANSHVANTDIVTVIPLDDNGVKLSTIGENISKVLVIRSDNTATIETPTEDIKYVPKTDNVDAQVNAVKTHLQDVTYEDLYDILNPRERFLDKEEIKRRLRRELGQEPTEEQIKAELKKLYLNKLDLRASFEKVQNELDTILRGLFERSQDINTSRVVANKKQILLGLAFLERQYKFEFNGIKAKDLILYHPEVFGTQGSAIDRIIQIGQMDYLTTQLISNKRAYDRKISGITKQPNILSFITKMREMLEPNITDNEWVKKQSKAYILEADSNYADTKLFEKMKKDDFLASHLIPLLTLSEDNLYAITTMSTVTFGLTDTYMPDRSPANVAALKEKMAKTASEQEAFLEFWYRISETKDRLLEGRNILVIDTMQKYNPSNLPASQLWSPETGPDSLSGVREFMAQVPGYYNSYIFVDGQANPQGRLVNMFLAKSLTDRGQTAYTHEVTHILDQLVWFNGHARRAGQGVEVFARGLFEVDNNTPGISSYPPMFNLNLTYELGENRVQNASPSRFEKESDLKEYAQGLMDVVYTLDYAEAKSTLGKSTEDKKLLLNKLELIPDSTRPNQVKDKFSNIDDTTANSLNDINDLVDKGIVSARLQFKGSQTTGEAKPNDYHIVPLFEPIYAGLQNNAGSAGDVTFRRYSYELLGEYGYKNGMVAYLSNQYPNDEQALNAILDNKYAGNLAEFKKDMFKRRIDKLDSLMENDVFTNYEELQRLMDEAVQTDLDRMKQNIRNSQQKLLGVGAVRNLKTRILQSYLNKTRDFRSSIYKEDPVLGTVTEEEEVEIPLETTNAEDSNLWEGESRTETGTAGRKKITKTWNTVDGAKVGEPVVSESVVVGMVPSVVYRGTKPVVGEVVSVSEVEVPVETTSVDDPSLWEGESRTVVGSVGRKVVTSRQATYKGVAQGDPVVSESVVVGMVPSVVYRGTKPVVGEVVSVSEVEVPVETTSVDDPSLWEGESRTVVGSVGRKVVTSRQATYKGVAQGDPVITETVLVQMKPTVIYRGTKPKNNAPDNIIIPLPEPKPIPEPKPENQPENKPEDNTENKPDNTVASKTEENSSTALPNDTKQNKVKLRPIADKDKKLSETGFGSDGIVKYGPLILLLGLIVNRFSKNKKDE